MCFSILGIGNTVGRILFGFLGDRPFVKRNLMLVCIMFFAGVSIALIAFFETFETKVPFAAFVGLFFGK